MTEHADLVSSCRIGGIDNFKVSNLMISCGGGNVSISLETGKVTFTNCTPDEAAKSFWDAVERMFPRRNPY